MKFNLFKALLQGIKALVYVLVFALGLALLFLQPSYAQSPRFSYNAGGDWVYDNLTKLVWHRCVEGMLWDGRSCTGVARTFTHEEALAYANSFTGWRLPNIKELNSIIDRSRDAPAVEAATFVGMPSPDVNSAMLPFWSSTPKGFSAYHVNFENGSIAAIRRNNKFYLRLVQLPAPV